MKQKFKNFFKRFFNEAFKDFLLRFSPFLIFSYISACFLASSFNILSLSKDVKIGFILFLGCMLVITLIITDK